MFFKTRRIVSEGGCAMLEVCREGTRPECVKFNPRRFAFCFAGINSIPLMR